MPFGNIETLKALDRLCMVASLAESNLPHNRKLTIATDGMDPKASMSIEATTLRQVIKAAKEGLQPQVKPLPSRFDPSGGWDVT